jgi:DNA-directed RNA polymerase specialized sigma24 family protein
VLAQVRPVVEALVRGRVRGLALADLEPDDAVQRVLLEVVLACRRWSSQHGPTRPPERYVWAAVHRARAKLYRSVKRAHYKVPADEVFGLSSSEPSPEEVAERSSAHHLYVEVVAGLFSALSEEDAVLMRLSAQGLTPLDIADQLGGDNVAVAQRLHWLRRRAREHLRRLGIEGMEDLHLYLPRPDESDLFRAHPC